MNKTLLSLPVILGLTTLTSLTAFAGGRDDDDDDDDHHHSRDCGHQSRPPPVVVTHRPMPPPGVPTHSGQYILQPVQRWVEASPEQIWVPEVCRVKGRYHQKLKCRPGYYATQWRPGYYETVQEWVWVPAPHYQRPVRYYPAPAEGGRFHASASPVPGVTVEMTGSF